MRGTREFFLKKARIEELREQSTQISEQKKNTRNESSTYITRERVCTREGLGQERRRGVSKYAREGTGSDAPKMSLARIYKARQGGRRSANREISVASRNVVFVMRSKDNK